MNYELGKKIISLSIFFVFFPVFTFAVSSATVKLGGGNATLVLSPSSGSHNVSDIFLVNITLDTGGVAIQGVDAYVTYNPSLLEVQDEDGAAEGTQVQAGSLMPDTLANSADNSAGKITFSQVTSAGASYTGSGTLATIRFKALSQGTASVSFDFISGKTDDTNVASSGKDILNSASGGSYIFNTPAPAPSPSPAPAPSPTPAPAPSTPTSSAPSTSSPTTSTPTYSAPTSTAPTTTTTQTTSTTTSAFTTQQPTAPTLSQSTIKEGSLIRGPDKIKVYIVNAFGFKRHIFNPAIFNMYGHFKWDEIKDVDQTTIDSYKTSDFYRADKDPRVFSLKEIDERQGKAEKRWLNIQGERFTTLGYKWEQVFIINEKERDYYQEGTPIGEQELQEKAIQTIKTIQPYSLVKTENSPTIYFITKQGIKKPILNEQVFNSYPQNNWNNIITTDEETLKQYPTATTVKLQGDAKIYIIDFQNKTKRWIKTADEFNKLGLSWDKVVEVNKVEFEAYAEVSGN